VTDLYDLQRRAQKLADDSLRELEMLVTETASILRELSPNRRKPWLASVVRELYDEQDGICALCGETLAGQDVEVDHKIAFCYGGGNERGNIQLAHGRCNRQKRAAVDPHDLLRYLEDRYMNL
jgi:5-methylcytosine-specific restriction endonuclease McrA